MKKSILFLIAVICFSLHVEAKPMQQAVAKSIVQQPDEGCNLESSVLDVSPKTSREAASKVANYLALGLGLIGAGLTFSREELIVNCAKTGVFANQEYDELLLTSDGVAFTRGNESEANYYVKAQNRQSPESTIELMEITRKEVEIAASELAAVEGDERDIDPDKPSTDKPFDKSLDKKTQTKKADLTPDATK